MKCRLCPRNCSVDRQRGEIGFCGAPYQMVVARYSLHLWEEPVISGEKGSGTIFFSYCNMRCCFCQNYEISEFHKGRKISIEEFSQICLELQEKGASNINLVTPTMYAYQIIEALKIAKSNGLDIPIIYNTNSYENVETIRALEGYIDVYLPDLKYFSDDISIKYSKVNNYFNTATQAILEMIKQVGSPIFDENGLIKKGVIVRHLVLPGHIQNSKHILKWLKENLDDKVYVSIMAQYFPTFKANTDPILGRKLSNKEYKDIQNFLYTLDFKNGYIQELGKHEEEYVPDFPSYSI